MDGKFARSDADEKSNGLPNVSAEDVSFVPALPNGVVFILHPHLVEDAWCTSLGRLETCVFPLSSQDTIHRLLGGSDA